MTEDERFDIEDLLPKSYPIWADEEEIPGWAEKFNYGYWMETLGHPTARRGCCKMCGCATSCSLGVFHEAMVTSVIRELDKLGLLRSPSERTSQGGAGSGHGSAAEAPEDE